MVGEDRGNELEVISHEEIIIEVKKYTFAQGISIDKKWGRVYRCIYQAVMLQYLSGGF